MPGRHGEIPNGSNAPHRLTDGFLTVQVIFLGFFYQTNPSFDCDGVGMRQNRHACPVGDSTCVPTFDDCPGDNEGVSSCAATAHVGDGSFRS